MTSKQIRNAYLLYKVWVLFFTANPYFQLFFSRGSNTHFWTTSWYKKMFRRISDFFLNILTVQEFGLVTPTHQISLCLGTIGQKVSKKCNGWKKKIKNGCIHKLYNYEKNDQSNCKSPQIFLHKSQRVCSDTVTLFTKFPFPGSFPLRLRYRVESINVTFQRTS